MNQLDEILERLYWERECIESQIDEVESMLDIDNIEEPLEEEKETLSETAKEKEVYSIAQIQGDVNIYL